MTKIAQWNVEKEHSRQNIRNKVLNELMETNDRKFNRELVKLNTMLDDVAFVEFLIIVLMNPYCSIQYLVSQMGQYLDMEDGSDVFDRAYQSFKLIYSIAEKTDLIELIVKPTEETEKVYVKSNYQMSDELAQYVTNTMCLPPMVCEPNPINTNRDSAYLTTEDHIIFKVKKQHDYKLNLDPINISNNIALSLDDRMLLLEELPKAPFKNKQAKINFNRMVESSKYVYKLLLDNGNKFYIPKKFDVRGRLYEHSYHAGIMKNTYRKGMIQLHKKYLIPLD